jgi:hypothetical protein
MVSGTLSLKPAVQGQDKMPETFNTFCHGQWQERLTAPAGSRRATARSSGLFVMLPGPWIGLGAQMRRHSAFGSYSRVPVEEVGGQLTDHDDPAKRARLLSSGNCNGNSAACGRRNRVDLPNKFACGFAARV